MDLDDGNAQEILCFIRGEYGENSPEEKEFLEQLKYKEEEKKGTVYTGCMKLPVDYMPDEPPENLPTDQELNAAQEALQEGFEQEVEQVYE